MDFSIQMFGHIQFGLNEGSIDEHARGNVCEFELLPTFYRLYHRLEIALHVIDADGKGVLEREILAVFGQNGAVIAAESQIFTNEDPVLCAAAIYAELIHVREAGRISRSIFLRIILSPPRLRIIL